MDWKYRRSDFRRPVAQLEHVDAVIRFFEDRVEAEGTLHLRARESLKEIALDCDGAKVVYPLDREYAPGDAFTVAVEHVSHPDDVHLEGIYRDVTPAGAPQQYMSQCQQYGFQRILPIVDDCTAKCTFRTALEGDARYTHLISNGDLVEDVQIADGRRRCVYEMRKPMAPYLFIACAGTWEVLALVMLFIGCMAAYTFVWDLGDVGIALMTIFNMIVLFPMSKEALASLRDYERLMKQRKQAK